MDIEQEPIEYQARYWKRRALLCEEQLKIDRKRKEPETLREVERALKDCRSFLDTTQRDRDIWKKIAYDESARVAELESEGATAVLKRERDQWRNSWKNCTRRLGNAIEHLGLEHTGAEPNADGC